MTELQKKQIETCRENGLTFAEIADVTGLSVGAVKSHFSRKTQEETVVRCRFCGAVVSQPKSQREKHFCNKEAYAFLLKVFTNFKEAMAKDASIYEFYATMKTRVFYDAFEDAGFKVGAGLVWKKPRAPFTISDISFSKPTKIRLTGKGRKSRIVTIPDSCTSILKEYLRARGMDVQSHDSKDRHLFSSQTHEHMTISCVEGIVKKYVTIAKEKHPDLFPEDSYSPHSFRHSIAMHMLEAGDNLVAIKAFLGHESISTTCIYATVTPELANRYLDARGKPLESVSTQIDNATQLPFILPYLY